MAGILIYQTASGCSYSFVVSDDSLYDSEIKDIPKRGDKILWERGNVSLEQIEDARKTKNTLVARLNNNEKVDLEKELAEFFK
jgi:hypothetical protein